MARKEGSNGVRTAREVRGAALRLFAEHGFAAVSMRQIASEIGVQAGTLYLYTADKQTLLSDLMIDHMESLLAAWDNARTEDPDPLVRLRHFVRFHIRYHLSRADEVFISYMELRNLNSENFAKVERLRRLYEAILEEIIHDGAERNLFRVPDPRIATLALIAMLTGVTTWYRSSGRLTPEGIEDLYCSMALGSLGATP